MTISTAKKILKNNGINWNNFFDLRFIEKSRNNWEGCENIYNAIQVIKRFLTIGR